MRRLAVSVLLLVGFTAALPGQDVRLPMKEDSLHFAVIGDSGTGDRNQFAVGSQLTTYRGRVPFGFAIMLGDNIYGSDSGSAFARKFEQPYKPLLDAGIKFYASLGNHDDPATQVNYKPFNMNGARYYTFRPKAGVRFFALDSNYMDGKQIEWLERELAASGSDWKIPYFHHPLYASGQHGSSVELRNQIEPLFIKYGVTVVFSGHEHFYERIKLQKGIQYFVVGNSAKVRRGDLDPSTGLTAKGYDSGYGFLIAEISGAELHFQAITEKGATIDSGVVRQVQRMTGIGNETRPEAATTGAVGSTIKVPPAQTQTAPTSKK